MTPKEKAKELFSKMARHVNDVLFENAKETAIGCALICVDEMIQFNGDLWLTGKINQKDYQHQNAYLFEVKQEIENL